MYQVASAEPFWLDFWTGVRVKFRPISYPATLGARRAVRGVLASAEEEIDFDDPAQADFLEDAGSAFSIELIRRGIVGWEGISGPDGEPIPVDPDTIAWFLADAHLMERADELYVRPHAAKETEKNVSALSPNGNSAGAIVGAPSAKTVRRSAKSAPTNSTPRKPKTASSSGTSSKAAGGKSARRSAARSASTSKPS